MLCHVGFSFYIPGPDVVKPFMAVIYEYSEQARVLVHGKSFKLRLITVNKERRLP